MPTRTGPLTKDTSTIAIGLAQIRVGLAATYISQIAPVLPESASIGALADTKFMGNVDFFKLESGFPLMEDAVYPLREGAMFEMAFKEITPYAMALARGLDPTSYTDTHKGSLGLGNLSTPVFVRMEAWYTFPDGTNRMWIIFPRAQVVASQELAFATEEPAASPISIEAKRADSTTSGGHTAWDNWPLGRFYWSDEATLTTTSTTTTTTA